MLIQLNNLWSIMHILAGSEASEAERWFDEAALVARQAKCFKAHCGTVIVKNGEIIGTGYNGPPLDQESNRTCGQILSQERKPLYDRTCCVHAEWRAVFDAAKRNHDKLTGSRLYFMRVDADGMPTRAGDPFCTVCSRLTMEAGISEFALWRPNGIAVWPADEYDRDSRAFFQ